MHTHWQSLFTRLGASGNSARTFHEIAMRYNEPHRVYHTLEHIKQTLDLFKNCRHLAGEPNIIEMAIWLHYIVHHPQRTDNARGSAEYARRLLSQELQIDPKVADAVSRLILIARSEAHSNNHDVTLLTDIDQAILGSPSTEYLAYEDALRREYAHVIDAAYYRERCALLMMVDARDHIYTTRYFEKRFGGQARSNLRRTIMRLRNYHD